MSAAVGLRDDFTASDLRRLGREGEGRGSGATATGAGCGLRWDGPGDGGADWRHGSARRCGLGASLHMNMAPLPHPMSNQRVVGRSCR